MASLLRQIVAGPRARHAEAGLDLCYVTDFIIATSGPSQTYPQLAYRNPLDQLVSFLDAKHGKDWAIWEFRAEGTGYPDEAVYGRVRHYPWPDHHPPPFRLVPMIMASMRNWLHGGDLDGQGKPPGEKRDEKRVAVVHCKAGKGRSGTVTTSYLIAEEGWTAEEALARFTARRMRPKFGAGVSIPSQLRWVSYVDRWTKHGKKYTDRAVEIVEIQVWGLRNGVKVDVEGFIDDGKKINVHHTFTRGERVIVEPGAPADAGIGEMLWDLAGYSVSGGGNQVPAEADFADAANPPPDGDKDKDKVKKDKNAPPAASEPKKRQHTLVRKGTGLIQKVSAGVGDGIDKAKTKTSGTSSPNPPPPERSASQNEREPGGQAVILRPSNPIILPNSDVSVSVERRNKTHGSLGLTMVSAVAHVWFNAFFEGRGPERGEPQQSGVFSIDWEAMDGIKGSSRKGSRALDSMKVVWRAVVDEQAEHIVEPAAGQPVPQVAAADWKGGAADKEKDLGLRTQMDGSRDVSRASSLISGEGEGSAVEAAKLDGVKSSGPEG